MKKPKAIICDVDGTVALMNGKRSPFAYWLAMDDDPNHIVIATVLATVRNIYPQPIKLLMVSARENMKLGGRFSKEYEAGNDGKITICENIYDVTKLWLDKHMGENSYHKLWLRDEGDHRKDRYVKYDLYKKEIEPNYDVVGVFDDRDQVVEMWRCGAGLTCFQVAFGNF